MNNEYEHNGVCFQWDECHEDIIDMDVEPGIKVVVLPSSVRMSKTEKMFPDVEELVIANNVKNILMPNTLFPNAKKVTSHSHYFVSGKYLIKRCRGMYTELLNVFCTSDDINLEYGSGHDVASKIADYAFAGSKSTVLLGTDSISSCDEFAFKDSAFENQPFVNGVKEIGGIVFDIDYDADEVILPDDKKTLRAYTNNIDLSKVKKLVIHNTDSLNYLMTSKIPPVIVVDSGDIRPDDMIRIVHSSRGDFVVKDVQFTDKVKRFVMHDGIVYTSDMKTLIAGLPSKKDVVIPEGVEEIHENAFYSCNIESVIMPDSLKVIGTFAFQECKMLNTVKFGSGLTRICERAFSACKNLKKVVLPDRLERMDSSAFSNSGLESITLGSGLNSLSDCVFAYTPMQEIHIPDTVTHIANFVFGDDIKSIIADNYIQNIEIVASRTSRRNVNDFVSISCNGKRAYIPKHVKPSMFDVLKSRARFFWSDEGEETCGFWDCSYSAKGREDEALAEYLEFGFIDAKEYLKKNSKRIITRLIEEGDEDKIVQFLSMGFVSKPTLKSLIPKAEEKELTIVSSYILKQIGDKKTSNRFAL